MRFILTFTPSPRRPRPHAGGRRVPGRRVRPQTIRLIGVAVPPREATAISVRDDQDAPRGPLH